MNEGLEGVVAARTVLSGVDGHNGIIWVRGHDIRELVATHGFEGTIALLWEGFAGDGLTREAIVAQLGDARLAAHRELGTWLPVAASRSVAEGVRVALAALAEDSPPAAIVGALSVAVAAMMRARQGEAPLAPDGRLTTAADLLRMAAGAPAGEQIVAALDAYLTTVIDNGLGSATFAGRVIASTRASLVSAVLGAYAAFTGPLHGGAPALCLDMLDAIATSGDIGGWLEHALAEKQRLYGFGHRFFRVRDPRADIFRGTLLRLNPRSARLALAREVESRAVALLEASKPGRRVQANMEMDAALLLEEIGLPREAFTPVFSVGRAPGWIAHAIEQQKTGRLIRPDVDYIGSKAAG